MPDDEDLLRRAFAVARRALTHGKHPFGAILARPEGQALLQFENGFMPDRDMTAHAERLRATAASRGYQPPTLLRCTIHTSAEPCAMRAGAIY